MKNTLKITWKKNSSILIELKKKIKIKETIFLEIQNELEKHKQKWTQQFTPKET